MVAEDQHGRRIYAVTLSSPILWGVESLLTKARVGLFLAFLILLSV